MAANEKRICIDLHDWADFSFQYENLFTIDSYGSCHVSLMEGNSFKLLKAEEPDGQMG